MLRNVSVLLFFICLPVLAIEVEVGKAEGCNLNPVFVGEETFYQITGEVIQNQRIIGLGMQTDYGQILRVEVLPESSASAIIRSNVWEYALVVLPPNTVEFDVKVWYRPLKPGNMFLRVCQSGRIFYRASVWIKNVPVTHTRPDVNWDGEVNQADVEKVEYYLSHPDQRDIGYYRCDVQLNNNVDSDDLALVKAYASLNGTLAPAKSVNLTTWGRVRIK